MAAPQRIDLRRPRAVTSADVARRAGVSQATVSLVLNGMAGRFGLTVSTQDRVITAAAALGYTPNHAAQSLRRRRTNCIAYVTSDLGNPYVAEVVAAVQLVAQGRGYIVNVIAAPTEEAALNTIARLRGGVCDGLLISGGSARVDAELRHLAARGLACVLLQDGNGDPTISCVRADLREGARIATHHLIKLGHRCIAHVTDVGRYPHSNNDRLVGYQEALAEAGIGFDPALLIEAENGLLGGAQAVRTLMQRKAPHPTAVFMYNDRMAAGGLHALRALGLRVPEDIAVVGFDGVALGAFTDPELTSIVHPREALGRLAAQTLFDLLDRVQPSQVTQTLPVQLVVRQSCGAHLSHSLRNESPNNGSGYGRGNHATEYT